MSVFHLFPCDVLGDCIGVVFKSQEWIRQMSNWVADGLEGVCKFGLELGIGDWTFLDGKERFGDGRGWVKLGFAFGDVAVCHFFTVAVIVCDGIELFPWVIM
eukprot:CAMPEP_0201117596 /NCGR_PEP_ID=MMETSP0850-20130426/1572_1 /ASSEMBLY_ACC=CAM_ASM_000622 /TAXON_ID=183588 /ORGANISM="Pseudo-nitzschia fraudulenta, Strain WWA7" /LENGTH=101 /DNA_ID=CAMNT_0047382039 /DNA_START=317 /DNA_END=622 /DNA_ORIENTATION=+